MTEACRELEYAIRRICHRSPSCDMIEIMSQDTVDLFAKSASTKRRLGAGAFVFQQGDPVRAMFHVVSGGVLLIRHQPDGAAIVLQRAAPGDILAEASLFADRYHCDAIAPLPTTLRSFGKRALRAQLAASPKLAEAWAGHLARELQATRTRAEILSLKTVAQRLDAWIAANQGAPPTKGEWKSLANEIGVSPEALYRELAKRRAT